MNYKNVLKKETKVIAYVVICLTLVVIGISYAMFLQVNKNTDNQVVETGSLVVTYKNSNGEDVSEGDIITSSLCLEPMEDSEAELMSECAYKLNVLNRGSLPASYKIIIYNNVEDLPNGGVFVDHSLLRIGVKKGNTDTGLNPVNTFTLSEVKHTDETLNAEGQNNIHYVLDEGVLEAGADITYSIQAWLNEELATGAVTGQYVYLKLEVNSVVSENASIGNDSDEEVTSSDEENLTDSGSTINE